MLLLTLVSELPRLGQKQPWGWAQAGGIWKKNRKKKLAELADRSLGSRSGEDWRKLRLAGTFEIRNPYF